ncbi:MAG: PEP-CTERM sorting domain-containing protein [Planctomycetota bacterium]
MNRGVLLFIIILVSAINLTSSATAAALDMNPPSWRGEPYTTSQQWELLTDDPQPYADAWDNPFGPMQVEVLPANTVPYYDFFNSAWKWENLGLTPEAHTMMQIGTRPNWPDSATDKEAWVQITWGVDFHGAAPPYDRADMLYVSGFDGIDGIFPTPAIDAQVLGVEVDPFGNAIEWYHTTFRVPFVTAYIEYDEYGNAWTVEEDAPWSDLFVFPFAPFTSEPLTSSYDIYISEVGLDTICVPEPATVMLLALGGLALRRKQQRGSASFPIASA